MNEIIELLSDRKGEYKGKGVNHLRKKFLAEMNIKPIVDCCGIQIDYSTSLPETRQAAPAKETTALNDDSGILHEEHTLITLDNNDELFLWTLCNSVSSMLALEFRNHERREFIKDLITFGLGHPQDTSSFREEITIVLWYDGDIEYVYSWGMPGDLFKIRSNVRMKKVS
jgi:hypothetical protein